MNSALHQERTPFPTVGDAVRSLEGSLATMMRQANLIRDSKEVR
jgi:hypothetical protein